MCESISEIYLDIKTDYPELLETLIQGILEENTKQLNLLNVKLDKLIERK